MSQTACWATNKVEECCWFSGGYGSIYDLSMFWVSLEGLKALVKMDWRNPVTELENFRLAGTNSRLRMRFSAYHINIPGDNGEKAQQWFEEVFPLAGWYQDEYMAFRKERGMTPYFNDAGYDDFFKTKPEWEMYSNCKRMSDVIGYSPFNMEYALGKKFRYFDGFNIVEDEDYNKRREEYYKKQEEMMNDFAFSPEEEQPKKNELAEDEIPSDRPTYSEMCKDERYISKHYEDGQCLIHIPKDFYAFGAIINDDGYYFEEEVCPPHEWFLFGGERNPKHFSHKYNYQKYQKFRRPYMELPADFVVMGGHIEEAERYYGKCSFQARDDLYENPELP
jgi:hypothetical protein